MKQLESESGAWRLHLLGEPRLEPSSQDFKVLHLDRAPALLMAMLAIDGPQSRDRLASFLWPDAPQGGRGNLRQMLLRLRRRCGGELIEGVERLRLVDGLWVDVHGVRQALADDPGLSRQELLAGIAHLDSDAAIDWLVQARRQHRAQVMASLQDRAGQLLTAGDHEHALLHAQQAVRLDATDEPACVLLMKTLYLAGRVSAGIEAFRHHEESLRLNVGVSAGAGVREVLRLLEQSQADAVDDGATIDGELRSAATEAVRLALARPPRTVGRDQEQAVLDRVVSEGGCVVLSGPPGIGKTRLLEDLQRQRAAALGAGARPSDRSEPYATATRMLRAGAQRWSSSALSDEVRSELARLVPEWGSPPATVVHTARLQWALDHAVQAWGAAGLQALLMDDLHYADDSSLQWLLRWADSASRQAVACVLSCRDQEMPELMRAWWERWSSAGDLIASPDSPHGVRASRPLGLALAPLTPQAIAELLQSLPADTPGVRGEPAMSEAEALHRQAGGTPLYLLHAIGRRGLADHALAQRPDPVRGFVQAQWRSLDATCARLLQVAALVEDRLDAGVAAAVLQVGVLDLDRPWRELESRGLLIDGAVSHDMLSQAVRETMPQAILVALHRMLAQARETHGDAPASVARHWHAAGEWVRAARAYEAAARVAGDRHAKREQLGSAESALACWERAGTRHVDAWFAAGCELAVLRVVCAQPAAAVELGGRLWALARGDLALARAGKVYAQALVDQGSYERAIEVAQTALKCALSQENECSRSWLALFLARALARLDRIAEATLELDAQAGDPESMPLSERLVWWAEVAELMENLDRRIEAISLLEHVIVEARRIGDWYMAGSAGCTKSTSIDYLGKASRLSLEAVEAAFGDYAHLGIDPQDDLLVLDQSNLLCFLRDSGRLREYLELEVGMPTKLRAAGYAYWTVNHGHVLAVAYCWLGRRDLASRILDEPLPDATSEAGRAARLLVQARLKGSFGVALNRPETWMELTRISAQRFRASGALGSSYMRLKATLEEARADLAEGLPADLDGLEHQTREAQVFGVMAEVRLLRLQHMLETPCAGITERARELFDQCRDDMPPNIYTPELWWTLHRALAQGDPDASQDALERAATWIDRVADDLEASWRPAFLSGNPINRLVLAARDRARNPTSPMV